MIEDQPLSSPNYSHNCYVSSANAGGGLRSQTAKRRVRSNKTGLQEVLLKSARG